MIPLSFHSKGRGSHSLGGALFVVLVLGIVNMAFGQSVRPCGPPQQEDLSSAGQKASNQTSKPPSRLGEWVFIPSLCVSERFDSNVVFASSGSSHDYVTHVAPRVLVKHSGEYVSGTFDVSGINETYAKNSGLNFFGGGGSFSLNFDKTIKRLLPNASFGIMESVRYIPLPPSFVNPVAGTSPGDPINPQDAFALGQIAFRTNNLTNNAGANFSYTISPATRVELSYSNGIIRYGASPLRQTITTPLFDITTHTGTVAGIAHITGADTMSVRYSFTDTAFNSVTTITSGVTNTTAFDRAFQSHAALLGWSRVLTPYLASELRGGATVINSNASSNSASSVLTTWAMNADLIFTDPNYPVTLSFARAAYPSLLGDATPVISNIVSLSASQRLGRDWQLAESANYSQSTGATSANNSGANRARFTTYRVGVDLYYWITRVWAASLSYDYMWFDQEFTDLSSRRVSSQFDRHSVTLGVKVTWE